MNRKREPRRKKNENKKKTHNHTKKKKGKKLCTRSLLISLLYIRTYFPGYIYGIDELDLAVRLMLETH